MTDEDHVILEARRPYRLARRRRLALRLLRRLDRHLLALGEDHVEEREQKRIDEDGDDGAGKD
jgi:hypothetical protein